MTASDATSRSHRDQRLDFWRGLCLVDMVLVHLVGQGMRFGPVGHEFFADYTRFAAGGYVLLSGMTVGFVFYPRVLDPLRRWASYLRLWRRAGFIFAVHVVVTIGEILVLCPMRGEPLPPLLPLVRDVLLMREGYDLLPFYMVMLLLSPVVLELMRRRLGWLVAVLSVGLFIGTHLNRDWQWAWFSINNTFRLGLWQIMFLSGLLVGTKLKWYDGLSFRTKAWVTGGFWLASVVIFFVAWGHHFGLERYGLGQTVVDARPLSPLTFWKNPLSVGEVLRYFALVGLVVCTSDLLWRRLRDSRLASMVNRMGRRSLAMYLAQIYLVGIVDHYADRAGGPWGTQFLFMTAAILLLWVIALVIDTLAGWRKRLLNERAASQERTVPLPS